MEDHLGETMAAWRLMARMRDEGRITWEEFEQRLEVLFNSARKHGVYKQLTARIVAETRHEPEQLTWSQRKYRGVD